MKILKTVLANAYRLHKIQELNPGYSIEEAIEDAAYAYVDSHPDTLYTGLELQEKVKELL